MGSDPVDASSDPERDALVAFYQATNGVNWTNNGSWLVEADARFGVTCDSNGRVTQLSMWSNNVDGPLPETIGNLRSLEVISLADNTSGSIPETIPRNLAGSRYRRSVRCPPRSLAIWNNGATF